MPTQTRIPTGSRPDVSPLERSLNRTWYTDNRPQFDPVTEGRKQMVQRRAGGFTGPQSTGNYAALPDETPAPYSNTPVKGQPLSKVKTLADFLAEQRQSQSPQPRPQPQVAQNRPTPEGYTPPPYRNSPTYVRPRDQLQTIGDWMNKQRSGSAPPPPIPASAPTLNPQNLTRPVSNRPLQNLSQGLNRSIAPAGRALAPLSTRLAPVGRAIGAGYRAVAPALPYIAAGLDFAGGVAAGESVGRSGAGALGSLAGSLAGAQAGAALGTLIAPGLGTIAGGIIGGAIGGFGGGWLADRLYDTLFPNDSLPDFNSPMEQGPAPPFYGGQSPGVQYDVQVLYDVRVNGNPHDSDLRLMRVYGPIYGVRAVVDNELPGVSYQIQLMVSSATNSGNSFYNASAGSGFGGYTASQSIVSVVRTNGQPDTGGNPAPQPGTPD